MYMSGWSPRKTTRQGRSIMLLAAAVGVLSTGTLLYHYSGGSVKFLSNPFSSSYSDAAVAYPPFEPTEPWPPASPHVPTEIPTDKDGHRYPPLYPDVTAAEYLLPQHNDSLPFPEGDSARFIRFANEQPGVGFNNQLKEVLLNSEIARRGGRTYVFADVVWDPNTSEPYVSMPEEPDHNHLAHGARYRAAKLPLRAFIDAPTSGSSWPANVKPAHAPRAVSVKWYERMCPPERRLKVDTREVNKKLRINLGNAEGVDIVDGWAKYLRTLDAHPCVELVHGSDRLIDWDLLSNTRILSLWPSLSVSPVLTGFEWSSVVIGAVNRNARRLWSSYFDTDEYDKSVTSEKMRGDGVVPGLVTLHVRRKDFYWHCLWLGPRGVFDGWNQLPFLPDRFTPPTNNEDARKSYLQDRCWTEQDAIVSRLASLRKDFPKDKLDKVYLSSNEGEEWIGELRKKLVASGWESVTSTFDLDLTWEESGVDNAIDMELASRGQVFVGNGFSSFTSTVVRLRLVDGREPKYTRFW